MHHDLKMQQISLQPKHIKRIYLHSQVLQRLVSCFVNTALTFIPLQKPCFQNISATVPLQFITSRAKLFSTAVSNLKCTQQSFFILQVTRLKMLNSFPFLCTSTDTGCLCILKLPLLSKRIWHQISSVQGRWIFKYMHRKSSL